MKCIFDASKTGRPTCKRLKASASPSSQRSNWSRAKPTEHRSHLPTSQAWTQHLLAGNSMKFAVWLLSTQQSMEVSHSKSQWDPAVAKADVIRASDTPQSSRCSQTSDSRHSRRSCSGTPARTTSLGATGPSVEAASAAFLGALDDCENPTAQPYLQKAPEVTDEGLQRTVQGHHGPTITNTTISEFEQSGSTSQYDDQRGKKAP